MGQSSIEITRLLAENEAVISLLYRAYAERFPSHENLWLALADEEKNHADWLRRLSLEIEAGMTHVDEGRFKPRPIEIMREYIGDQLRRAHDEDLTLTDALSTALDIELGLLERDYFKIFQTDSPTVKQTLMNLEGATGEHIKQVREAWEAAKG